MYNHKRTTPRRILLNYDMNRSNGKFKRLNNIQIYSLGIRLMARNGLSTRIVRMAEKFIFSTFKQYSRAL